MAELSKYERLCAGVSSAVSRNQKHKSGDKEWQMKAGVFSLPDEIVKEVREYCYSLTGQKLEKVTKKDPAVAEQYLELKNLFRVFGDDVKPNFGTQSGALSELYPAGIHKTNPKIQEEMGSQHELCLRFGNKFLAIEYDASKKKWVVIGSKEPAVIRFDYGNVKTKEGDAKILLGIVCIDGSDDIEDRFVAKVATKRDEKNKNKDAFPASEVQTAFSKNQVSTLVEMLTIPSTGGGNWTYHFSDDVFEFGRYPVVSLKKEKRTSGKKIWTNYVVNVIGANGSEMSVRLDMKDQTIWNTLSSTYPWTDEDGNVFNENGEVDEDDFLACIKDEKQNYCIIYSGKTKKSKTYQGITSEYWETSVNFEVSDATSFQKLSASETKTSNGVVPIKNTPITGIDDLLATEELQESIPF